MLDTLTAYGDANPGYALVLSALLVPFMVLGDVALLMTARHVARRFPAVTLGLAAGAVMLTAYGLGNLATIGA